MKQKPKSITAGIAALAPVTLSNFSSLPDVATNSLAGGAGAYLGHELTGGKPEGALFGAVFGIAAGGLLNYSRKKGRQKAYSSGNDNGRSDEVKRFSGIMKGLHRAGRVRVLHTR